MVVEVVDDTSLAPELFWISRSLRRCYYYTLVLDQGFNIAKSLGLITITIRLPLLHQYLMLAIYLIFTKLEL